MALENFMNKFDKSGVDDNRPLDAPSAPGALAKFLDKFNGVTEGYFFYNNTIELRFQPDEHIYYLVGELGQMIPQDGVTTIVHIIDKSMALVPWAAKMAIEKLLRTIPIVEKLTCPVVDPTAKDYIHAGSPMLAMPYIAEMTLADFTKIALEAKSAPRDKLEEAGDVGHMAHTWLEFFIKAVIAGHVQEQESKLANMPKDERAHNCVLAALGWMKKHNVRWIATERKVYSKKYSFAGTTDGLALVDSCGDPLCKGCKGEVFKDRLSVVDWKSSNYLYIEYLYQVAAYLLALMEEFGEETGPLSDTDAAIIRDAIAKYGPITDKWILRLGKDDGEFDPWHTSEADQQEDLEGFLDCLSLTRSVHLTEERVKGQKEVVREAKKKAKAEAKEADKVAKKEAKDAATAERRRNKELEKQTKKDAKAVERLSLRESKSSKATIVDASDAYVPRWCVSCHCQDTERMQELCLDCPCGCSCKDYTNVKPEPAAVEPAGPEPVSISVPVFVENWKPVPYMPVETVIAKPTIMLPVEV